MALTFDNCCTYTNFLAFDPQTGPQDRYNFSQRFFVLNICQISNADLVNNGPYYYSIKNLTTNTFLAQNALFPAPTVGASTCVYRAAGFPTQNVPTGNYEVSVWSGTNPGNVLTQVVNMPDPTALNDLTYTITPNTACSGSNGVITVSFTGTLPQYYSFNGSPAQLLNGVNPLILGSRPAGNNSLSFNYLIPFRCGTVTGSLGGATYTYPVVTNGVNQIGIVPTVTPEVCTNGAGSISLALNGGTPPYTYSWSGPGGYTSTNQDITGLSAGNYTVVVTDTTSCTGTALITVTDVPDANGCVAPVTCYKAVNCNPDCFGPAVYYFTDADLSPLLGYIINGLDVDGEAINPTDCWTIEETDPAESTPAGGFPCYVDLNIGTNALLIDCNVYINGISVYVGNPIQANTASFITEILNPGNITGTYTLSPGSNATSFSICAPDFSYAGDPIVVAYRWFDNLTKSYVSYSVTVAFDTGIPGTGCYNPSNFLGYNTAFSNCELCAPPVCPEEPPFVKIIPDPVKIYYQIAESKCDITATKQFATAYSNMLKKIKYGIADCCNGLNIAETWVNKQISNLQATIIPGYNCRTIPMDGCNWLPLQGCEILSTPSEGTSILARAGEDIVYAKLVMLQSNGLIYLNQPLVETTYQRAIGFTTMDVMINSTTRVLVNGMITNPAWSLVTGAIYFAAPNGGITTTVPTTGISQMVGIAVNATTLFVDIKQPNILC